eukprot:m.101620 g.101620  ORF g.101620 m.101620 type:complete len:445 (-) comp13748_c0_seq3:95-1429(-)
MVSSLVSSLSSLLLLSIIGFRSAASFSCLHNESLVNLSKSQPGWDRESCVWSGFLPIRPKEPQAKLFYMFFESQSKNTSAPVVLWTNGGPGTSSMLGNFAEIGPYRVDNTSGTMLNVEQLTWNRNMHLLFVDHPIGVGFSTAQAGVHFAKNESEVAADMSALLHNFFMEYSEYQASEFFVTGESYGGRFVPSIGLQIFNDNKNSVNPKINLKGVAVGNGYSDPCIQIPHAPRAAFEVGIIGFHQFEEGEALADELVASCAAGLFVPAFATVGLIYDLILQGSGGVNNHDWRIFTADNFTNLDTFLNLPTVQSALHVPPTKWELKNNTVFWSMTAEQMQSMAPKYTTLLNNGIKAMIYHGQTDPRYSISGETAWVRNINWTNQEEFKKKKRSVWSVQGSQTPAAYMYNISGLALVTVLQAGHLAPLNQPQTMLNLMEDFVFDRIA